MASNDNKTDATSDSAPDLKIFGDEITLQPSGYVEPAIVEGKEEALMSQFASFRAEPLKYSQPRQARNQGQDTDVSCQISSRSLPSCVRHWMARLRSSHRPTSLLQRIL